MQRPLNLYFDPSTMKKQNMATNKRKNYSAPLKCLFCQWGSRSLRNFLKLQTLGWSSPHKVSKYKRGKKFDLSWPKKCKCNVKKSIPGMRQFRAKLRISDLFEQMPLVKHNRATRIVVTGKLNHMEQKWHQNAMTILLPPNEDIPENLLVYQLFP